MSTNASESAPATVVGTRTSAKHKSFSREPDRRNGTNHDAGNGHAVEFCSVAVAAPEVGDPVCDAPPELKSSSTHAPNGLSSAGTSFQSVPRNRKQANPPVLSFDGGSDTSEIEPRIQYATPGDHAAVYNFLTTVFQGPPRDAFLATLDDPFYEPSDRLLIKSGHRLLAHAHVSKRVIHFGPISLPVAGLHWLATSPEYRGRGFARTLLKAAHDLMVEDGSVLATLNTSEPHFFRSEGWAVCGRHCHSSGCTRDLLSQLTDRDRRQGRRLSIRPWRQVELPGVMRVFRQNTEATFGPVERTEAYWRWLVSRKGFDQLFVAIAGPDRLDIDEGMAHIVGYMITKRDHIVELFAAPEHPEAIQQLLARGCSDAIEHDYHQLVYHGSANDPVHSIFQSAGGSRRLHESYNGEVTMIKLFDPVAFLKRISPILHHRATAAKLNRPTELGLVLDGQKISLKITRRGVRVTSDKIGRSHLTCNIAEFTRLVMGHVDVEEVVAAGRIEASTQVALQLAAALFPPLPLWRPAMDELVL